MGNLLFPHTTVGKRSVFCHACLRGASDFFYFFIYIFPRGHGEKECPAAHTDLLLCQLCPTAAQYGEPLFCLTSGGFGVGEYTYLIPPHGLAEEFREKGGRRDGELWNVWDMGGGVPDACMCVGATKGRRHGLFCYAYS